jgi:REP element-mobilizing transposase RayT
MDSQRSRTDRLLHTRREVVPSRPMHLTVHVRPGVPRLRRQEILDYVRELMTAAQRRGVRTVASALLDNHWHWIVVPQSAAALTDATRFVYGHLAKFINRCFGRRGRVFRERFASGCCRNVRHAFQVVNYVLKNAVAAGYRLAATGFDRFTDVFDDVLAADRFLRSVFGPTPAVRQTLLARMARAAVPFVPVAERCQPRLPGL